MLNISYAQAMDIIKVTTTVNTYLGSKAKVTTEHHDKNRVGLRTITMEWLEDAHELNGGYPAGTVTRKVIKGDGRYTSGPKACQVIEEEKVIS